MNNNLLVFTFLRSSQQFLNLVRNSCEMIIENKNKWVLIKDHEISEDRYHELTKWSDHQRILPLLFNFYHGLELLIKAYLFSHLPSNKLNVHNIEYLRDEFLKIYAIDKSTSKIIKKYTNQKQIPKLLHRFMKDNKFNPSQFYEAFRYPTDASLSMLVEYDELRYHSKEGLPFFNELKNDIDNLIIEAVQFYRIIEKK